MASYSVKVAGTVTPGNNLESADTTRTDNFGNKVIEGSVVNAPDTWTYEGDVLDLQVPSGFALDINGNRVNPTELLKYYATRLDLTPPNTDIGNVSEAMVTAEGRILGTDSLGGNDSISQNSDGTWTARINSGMSSTNSVWVLGGFDKTRTSINESQWTVEYGGSTTTVAGLPVAGDGPSITTSELEIRPANGGLAGAEYIVQVSGKVQNKSSIESDEPGASYGGSGEASGTLYTGSDVYEFTGEIQNLYVPQDAAVLVDGQEVNFSTGNHLEIESLVETGGATYQIDLGSPEAVLRGPESELQQEVHSDGSVSGEIGLGVDDFFVYGSAPTWSDVTLNGVSKSDVNIRWNGSPIEDDTNQAPSVSIASVSTSDLTVNASASVSDPDNNIQSVTWDFGDGTQKTGRNVSHTYASSGTYQITVTATDTGGLQDSASTTVQVQAPNPAPNANISYSISETEVTLDGSASSDPNNQITSYEWAVGGQSYSGMKVTDTFSPGTYTVTLTVRDAGGKTDTSQATFTVSETDSGVGLLAGLAVGAGAYLLSRRKRTD